MNDMSQLKVQLHSAISVISPDISNDLLTARVEEVLYNYDIQHRTNKDIDEDLTEKIAIFISAKKLEGKSPNTLKDYSMELRLFSKHISKATIQINTSDIRSYLSSLEDIEASTRGKKLTVLKSFFGWMVEEEILLRDPSKKIKLPNTKKRIPKGLTIGELSLVKEMCKNKRERALVEVFFSTGARVSELSGMKLSNLNRQDMSISVIGKGNKEGIVYLSETAMYHLNNYLNTRDDDCDYLFITRRKPYRQMQRHTVSDEIEKIESRCGLNKKLTPHVFRHTLGQTLLNKGATLEVVQHILRHADISTTQIYAHVSEESKRSAHKRLI